jgi:linoleoyl-CoA desaturase
LNKQPLTFSRTYLDFSSTLNSRVNEYFKLNNLSKQGNPEMFSKTAFMFLLYFLPYALIITGVITSALPLIALVIVMSMGLSGIGLSVMHDANHGSYSRVPIVNSIVGYSLNLVGANSFNWKMQHNVLHHTYTNVHDHDEDIVSRGILRLDPHTKWKKVYKYQRFYAWFLYGLMTLSWMIVKDFARLRKYHKNGMAKKHKANIFREWAILVFTKLFYIGYILVIPLVFTSLPWYMVVAGIVVMHYLAGFFLAIIFQPAHVIDGTEFPLPNNENQLANNWNIHQLLTTTNFGNRSKLFSWFVGGLNFQIEHHLFPNVCHVHYRKISSIVKSTAEEFGLPYKSERTFAGALRGHWRMLSELGRKPVAA